MKRCISKAVLVAAIALPAMSNAAWAGGTDDFGCSNATLKGEYAFGVTAYTPPGLPNGPPRVVTGIRVYDGNGHFTQRDYQGDNLAGPDFAPPGRETGTYQRTTRSITCFISAGSPHCRRAQSFQNADIPGLGGNQ